MGRAEYTPEQLRQAADSGLFLGVVWDEVAHRQLHHIDVGPGPHFFDPQALPVTACYERMVETVNEARTFIAPHLGAADTVCYQFGAYRVEFTPQGGDARRLSVTVLNEA